jgi:hypothetical protein
MAGQNFYPPPLYSWCIDPAPATFSHPCPQMSKALGKWFSCKRWEPIAAPPKGFDYPLLITPLFTPGRYLSKIANSTCVFYVISYHKVHKATPRVRELSTYTITILNQMGNPGYTMRYLPLYTTE